MKIFRAISTAWHNRKKKTWTELSDWTLAFIGAPSFLVGSFYLWVVSTTTPDLLILSRDHGLPLNAILAFAFLGGLALSSWFFLSVARRCGELLYERNFK
ncbi:hypothetical protein [Pseudomonas piscis]|uniref:hypothetical protein n=1 Tax=Pseudomonas piscis TaxID=2614538 RepID=UPI0021D584D8|nr:hypothetical protein [Pseudomonas piscis]MCU7645668.1 hypothetical protein [Pseudomonas piscis]